MKSVELGEILSDSQLKEIEAISQETDRDLMSRKTHKDLLNVIKKDSSKWEDLFVPEFLAYALQANLPKIKSCCEAHDDSHQISGNRGGPQRILNL